MSVNLLMSSVIAILDTISAILVTKWYDGLDFLSIQDTMMVQFPI